MVVQRCAGFIGCGRRKASNIQHYGAPGDEDSAPANGATGMQCAAATATALMALMAAVRPSASTKLNLAYDAKTMSGTSLLPLGAPCRHISGGKTWATLTQ